MGVIDGQAISAAITNAAFLNKNQADQMPYPVSFTKTLSLSKRDESSAATINALDSSSSLVNVTGTVTTINGAVAPTTYSDGAILVIRNSSTNAIVVANESASATAANRFALPNSATSNLLPGQAIQLVYNSTTSRWNVVSGISQAVACRYTNSAGTAVTSAYNVKIFPTVDYDTHSAYNTGTGVWTAPFNGRYRAMIRSHGATAAYSTTNGWTLQIRKNSAGVAQQIRYGNGASIVLGDSLTTTFYCVAGDTVDFVVRCSISTTMYADDEFNQIEIVRVGD